MIIIIITFLVVVRIFLKESILCTWENQSILGIITASVVGKNMYCWLSTWNLISKQPLWCQSLPSSLISHYNLSNFSYSYIYSFIIYILLSCLPPLLYSCIFALFSFLSIYLFILSFITLCSFIYNITLDNHV